MESIAAGEPVALGRSPLYTQLYLSSSVPEQLKFRFPPLVHARSLPVSSYDSRLLSTVGVQ